MDDSRQRRLCDGLTGASASLAIAAVVAGAWRLGVVALGVAVIAQLIRSSIDS